MDTVAHLGTIMGIWAHPDDETWASAGLMAYARDNGQRVVCVIATNGEAGKTDDATRWPAQQLTQIRMKEMHAALQIVGVSDIRLLGYPDGGLSGVDEVTLVKRLVEEIKAVKPDTIITFEASGITGHADHRAIARAVYQAAEKADKKIMVYGACETKERYDEAGCSCDKRFNVYFNTDKPTLIPEAQTDLLVTLDPGMQARKQSALQAHASQTSRMFADTAGKCYLTCLCQKEAFIELRY